MVKIVNGRLIFTGSDGFHLVVPMDRVQSFDPADRDDVEGIPVRVEMHPVDHDHVLQFYFVADPGPNRVACHAFLEGVRDRVDGVPVRAPVGPAPEAIPPVPVRPPFVPMKGPDLLAVADGEEWLVLWPLEDTVALSKGELIVPGKHSS
jgi:hypothetical protein